MAKPFTTYQAIRGKEPFLRRIVCEIRYQDGQLYLDHCGRLLKKLMRDCPEWIISPSATPQGTSVFNVVAGILLGFSASAASLTLDRTSGDEIIREEEAEEYCQQIGSVLAMVVDELEVTEFLRLGYREQYYFSCDSKEESQSWLRGLGLVNVAPGLYESFKAQPEALGGYLVLQGEYCRYRIALNGVERSAQVPVGEASVNFRTSTLSKRQNKAYLEALKRKRHRQIAAAFSVVLDMDAYLLEPVEPDLAVFVRERMKTNLDLFRGALPKEPEKKK